MVAGRRTRHGRAKCRHGQVVAHLESLCAPPPVVRRDALVEWRGPILGVTRWEMGSAIAGGLICHGGEHTAARLHCECDETSQGIRPTYNGP